jgi:eukaryotic-like serine/threonine-protein kinase
MGLTQKILLFVSALVIALVATSLLFTTVQANQLAHFTIDQGLRETREVWETFQVDRYKQLRLGLRVLANDPYFKAALGERDQATTFDSLKERGKDLGADFMLATDPAGIVVARSDRPGATGDDLARDPIVMKPIEGEESATIWRQGDRLFNAVSVPMQTGPTLVGVLVAGYGINEALAGQIRKLTRSEIAYLVQEPGKPAQLSVSSLGAKEGALKAAIGRPDFGAGKGEMESFELDLAGERYVGVQIPLRSASGEVVGSALALRSLAEETASFHQFRNSLIVVSLGLLAIALGLAYVAAKRITGPVRTLVNLVERARDGSFTGNVFVNTGDEIGTLARTFNSLMADLRQRNQMIEFMREGMTMLKKSGGPPGATLSGAGVTLPRAGATTMDTAALPMMGSGVTGKIEQGQVFDGRYEIEETLGRGGMGVVYRARDRELDEIVALKVLRSEALKDDPNLLERFKEEIRLARKITHRNVLRTHDIGESDGLSYISMEYLEGKTLKDLIKERGALPLGVGLSIAKQICNGLEAAHLAGIVHRDIKPQNMLIIPESGELKIMDFGIARRSQVKGTEASGLTSAGTVMGTPDYMPPEQAQGLPADVRSDIYSLGVVLFETFAGTLPFKGDTITSIVMGHIQKPPPRPRSINPRLPVELEALILRCLAKDPAKRFAQVSDIREALTAISATVEAAREERAS